LCLGESRSSEEAAVATTKVIAAKLRLNCGQRGKTTDLATGKRKQLTILNTMMKNGTHWDEKLA
jgi:hypothetical protein